MLKLLISEEAKAELTDIVNFTKAQWGNEQSKNYLQTIRLKIDFLRQMPNIGVDRSKELQQPARCYFVGRHVIYYVFDAETLTILAILHQNMIPLKYLPRNTLNILDVENESAP